jgi:hypothetical protein
MNEIHTGLFKVVEINLLEIAIYFNSVFDMNSQNQRQNHDFEERLQTQTGISHPTDCLKTSAHQQQYTAHNTHFFTVHYMLRLD